MATLSPGFHKLLSVTVTTYAVVPSCIFLLGGDDNCMLSVSFCSCDPRVSGWQGGDICQATVAAFLYVLLRTLILFIQMRMTSFLFCLLVLSTCYLLLDSRLFGLTLGPSAPVSCCHRVSWTRGRLAFAQEAVRCPHLFFLLWWHLPGGLRLLVGHFFFKRC